MIITEADKVYASKFFAAYHGISPEELENKGRQEGIIIGIEKGIEKGRQEGIIIGFEIGFEIGIKLSTGNVIKCRRYYTDEQIADLLGVEPKMVSQVRASLDV